MERARNYNTTSFSTIDISIVIFADYKLSINDSEKGWWKL